MFKFINLRYVETSRGVEVSGMITYNGKGVGTFTQLPFAACIASFVTIEWDAKFTGTAGSLRKCDYAERLLNDAEALLLA